MSDNINLRFGRLQQAFQSVERMAMSVDAGSGKMGRLHCKDGEVRFPRAAARQRCPALLEDNAELVKQVSYPFGRPRGSNPVVVIT